MILIKQELIKSEIIKDNKQDDDNEGTVRTQSDKSENSKNLNNLCLNLEDIQKGKNAIIHFVQHQYFEDEFMKLRSGFPVKCSSKLHKLDPFIDTHGILRVGGRLRQSDLPDEMKHPIILLKTCNISHLIVRDIHRKIGHLGKNSILTHLRERYWIIGANAIIKSIVSKCVVCRKYQSPIIQQKMADLPSDRVTPDMPPFTAVGIGYFGPFEIRQRRCSVKRYGVIFTCLKMRAILRNCKFVRYRLMY
ncbi:unnamed protein product [Mytilus coruscus]|uniref:Integrase zinc-binding domain-containing protein n=1 Tax=Mytilus coruscus TaxID=42192 RepID=A0A6J8CYD2_MYTCO|nr:unnamed protein product [Mytilus coruscus]